MTTDFAAIESRARRAAELGCTDPAFLRAYAAGYEIAALRELVAQLERTIASMTGELVEEPETRHELADMIEGDLIRGEIDADLIADMLSLPEGGPVETRQRFRLSDGSEFRVSIAILATQTKDADPGICSACSGSGEGMSERTRCCVCGGSGVAPMPRVERYED